MTILEFGTKCTRLQSSIFATGLNILGLVNLLGLESQEYYRSNITWARGKFWKGEEKIYKLRVC